MIEKFLIRWWSCLVWERRYFLIIVIVFMSLFMVCFKRQERLQAMKAFTRILYLLLRFNKRR